MSKKTNNNLTIVQQKPEDLKPNPKNPRTHSKKQIQKIAKSINEFGFVNPVLIDENGMIVAGHGRVEGAKLLGIELVPTICLEHLTKDQIRAYVIADNRLAEESGWDKEIVKIDLEYLMSLEHDFDATVTGFDIPEIDLIINSEIIKDVKKEKDDPADELPEEDQVEKRVSLGDLWQLGEHKMFCGDSLKKESFEILMGQESARMALVDMPYNVKIQGNVTTQKHHKEFAYASGEMNKTQFTNFMKTAMTLLADYSVDGSIHFHFMDWKHLDQILQAGNSVYSEFKNLCVWAKEAGLGSFYRNSHELCLAFKKGNAPHLNNFGLGALRYRTNLWSGYKSMHISNPESKQLLKWHPTPKPVKMLADAILDVSKPGDIVIDSFSGIGSVLLAAERTKRKARVIELEPEYCDVILHRWMKLTGKKAVLVKNMKRERNV